MADKNVEEAVPYAIFWCDLETTGLDPQRNRILELAYKLTKFVYPYSSTPQKVHGSYLVEGGLGHLEISDYVVREMHEKSGLASDLAMDNLQTEKTPLAQIEHELLVMSEDWPLEKGQKVIIGGNSCHFDLEFLRERMPTFAKRLSHRTFDPSGYYRFCRSLGMPSPPRSEVTHRAAADLEDAIRLARICAAWTLERQR